MSARQVLLNPGPVTLSERVRAALGRADWCHREPEFAALTQEINHGLARVYPEMAGGFEAVTITGSGTAAVEGMLQSFAPRTGGTLVVANGVYGERIAAMLAAQGKPCWCAAAASWLEGIDLVRAAALLDAHPEVTHVAAVHHETTTGRLNDLDALGALCKERGLRLLLDCVSSFGAEALDVDGWNVAALAATANKCLHGAPGLSFVLARAELWPGESEATSVYLNLRSYHRLQHHGGSSPFTLAVHVAFALREALAEHAEAGGWQERRASYRRRARAIAGTLGEARLETLLPATDYSSVLWSWSLPRDRTYEWLHDALKQRGFVIYAGQGNLSGRVFRIAHMGDIDGDIDRLRGALADLFKAAP